MTALLHVTRQAGEPGLIEFMSISLHAKSDLQLNLRPTVYSDSAAGWRR